MAGDLCRLRTGAHLALSLCMDGDGLTEADCRSLQYRPVRRSLVSQQLCLPVRKREEITSSFPGRTRHFILRHADRYRFSSDHVSLYRLRACAHQIPVSREVPGVPVDADGCSNDDVYFA